MTNDALPPLTEAQKHHAFEWLRQEAMHNQSAYVAFRAWAELKVSQSEAPREGWKPMPTDWDSADRLRAIADYMEQLENFDDAAFLRNLIAAASNRSEGADK